MIENYLWMIGSVPFIILGAVHLLYTFFTPKFSSRNNLVNEEMKKSSPILTRETTMWKAWVGFNASHSAGAIYIGLVNVIIAIQYPGMVTYTFQSMTIITSFFYLWLAKKYWFNIPFKGILFSTCCYCLSLIFSILRQ